MYIIHCNYRELSSESYILLDCLLYFGYSVRAYLMMSMLLIDL